MNKKEKLAFAFVAALAMTSGGFAFGQSVNNVSSDQVIYACVTGVNGNITKVSNTPKTCPRGTTPISWNMVGPKGDQGVQGIQGIQGIQGLKGDKGESNVASTNPSLYLLGPKDERIPFVSSWFGQQVMLGGVLWRWTGSELGADELSYGWSNTFHKSSDCSGNGYLMTRFEEPIWSNMAFQDSTSKKYVLLNKSSGIELSLLGSIESPSSGCLSFNKSNISRGLSALVRKVEQKIESIDWTPEYAEVDFSNCEVKFVDTLEPPNGRIENYKFDDCSFSEGDLYILNSYLLPSADASAISFPFVQEWKDRVTNLALAVLPAPGERKFWYEAKYVEKPNISNDSGWFDGIR